MCTSRDVPARGPSSFATWEREDCFGHVDTVWQEGPPTPVNARPHAARPICVLATVVWREERGGQEEERAPHLGCMVA